MFMLPLLFCRRTGGRRTALQYGAKHTERRSPSCGVRLRPPYRPPSADRLLRALGHGRGEDEIVQLAVVRVQDVLLGAFPPFAALVDVDDLLPDLHDGVHVVGVDDRGDVVLLGNLVDQVVDDDRSLRIEARVGLVAEEVARVQDDRARDGHALDHAARQLRRVEIVGVFEPHAPQAEIHALAFLGLRLIGEEIQRQADVLRYGRRVQQRSALKDHADVLADRLALLNPSAV